MPMGSRTAMSSRSVRKSSEYAPSTCASASAMRSSTPRWLLIAMRWTIASVSVALWKIEPLTSSRSRSSAWFVRLPLWATASEPRA